MQSIVTTKQVVHNLVGQVNQRGFPMIKISVYEAKTQLSKYLSLLANGEEKEIIIMKNGIEVAKLIPSVPKKIRLGLGLEMFGERHCNIKDPAFEGIEKEFGY